MVFLKYNFIFDSSDTWTNLSEFENSLAKYFSEHDMEAKIIQTVSGQVGDRLMLISRTEATPVIQEPKESKGIVVKEKKIQRIKKGNSPIQKIADKPRSFSFKKGRKLKETYTKKLKLGGK
jgi:hypothetical protein